MSSATPAIEQIANAPELIDKWGQKLADVVSQHGPQAAELALSLGQIAAAKDLIGAFVGLAFVGAVVRWGLRPAFLKIKTWFADDDLGLPAFFGSCILVLAGIFCTVIVVESINRIANPFLWIGLVRPEVFLAAKALGLSS